MSPQSNKLTAKFDKISDVFPGELVMILVCFSCLDPKSFRKITKRKVLRLVTDYLSFTCHWNQLTTDDLCGLRSI